MAPKYQAIAEDLQMHIKAGKYAHARMLPTEASIAEAYGVSRQTVRQALASLAQLGLIEKRQGSGSYICRPAGSEQSNRSVAVIITYITDYIFPDVLREMTWVFSQNGCIPSLFATQNQVYQERSILSTLLQSPPDGILVEGTKTSLPNPNLDLYRRLIDQGVPLVFFHGNYAGLHEAPYVLDDNYGGGQMLVRHLYKKGHRSIAGFFKSDDIQGHQRYAGYADALRELGLAVDDRRLFWYDTAAKEQLLQGRGLEAASQVLEGCTAVVCYNDEIASRLAGCLLRKGVKIPGDLAIVSFDNSQYSELSPVRLTSLSHGENNVGRLAAEMLIRLMQGESCRPELAPWVLEEKESG